MMIARLYLAPTPSTSLTPDCLFLPAISSNRSPLSECDYNIHKSNSTYFTDVDISRANLCCVLFGNHVSAFPGPDSIGVVLGGMQCVFKREIKPYQPYEIWSRVMTWDEKWLYVVSHFVEKGVFYPETYLLRNRLWSTGKTSSREATKEKPQRKVFASIVSRYVFKRGRLTCAPTKMLENCGLLPRQLSKETPIAKEDHAITHSRDTIEQRRQRDLPAAQLHLGWDAVHEAFNGHTKTALGRYME